MCQYVIDFFRQLFMQILKIINPERRVNQDSVIAHDAVSHLSNRQSEDMARFPLISYYVKSFKCRLKK